MKIGVIGAALGVAPTSIEAQILGEHDTSEVFVWSGVRAAGVPLAYVLSGRGPSRERIGLARLA